MVSCVWEVVLNVAATQLHGFRRLCRLGFAAMLAAAFGAAPASASDLARAVAEGAVDLSLRYRFEHVNQDGFDEQASASTGKARLTWTSGEYGALTFGIETDYAFVVGIEDFNSTDNGKTEYPIVADPQGFDLNQAFVRHKRGGLTVTAGRQRILHGSQRFLGGVAWRQNEQTYDALRFQLERGRGTIDYSYIHNVNRIFGPGDGAQPGDWYGDTHALYGTLQPAEGQTLAGFAYFIDLTNANGPPNSNRSYGIDYTGVFGPMTLTASVARQSDFGDSPLSYDATYYTAQGAWKLPAATLTVGYEVLGSDDGQQGFRMPLATLHKFQGWTDRFLGTPAAGVRDAYVTLSGQAGGVNLLGAWHRFSADEGGMDYGDEIGFSAVWPANDHLDLQFKAARYSADEFASDITKFWFQATVSF